MTLFLADRGRVFVNDTEIQPTHSEPADYRTRLDFEGVAQKKGWDHLLVRVVATNPQAKKQGTLAVHITSNSSEFLKKLESAIQGPDEPTH